MADLVDNASKVEQAQRQAAIAKHAAAKPPVNVAGVCSDCDAKILSSRLRAKPNAQRCYDCQVIHEQEMRFGR